MVLVLVLVCSLFDAFVSDSTTLRRLHRHSLLFSLIVVIRIIVILIEIGFFVFKPLIVQFEVDQVVHVILLVVVGVQYGYLIGSLEVLEEGFIHVHVIDVAVLAKLKLIEFLVEVDVDKGGDLGGLPKAGREFAFGPVLGEVEVGLCVAEVGVRLVGRLRVEVLEVADGLDEFLVRLEFHKVPALGGSRGGAGRGLLVVHGMRETVDFAVQVGDDRRLLGRLTLLPRE